MRATQKSKSITLCATFLLLLPCVLANAAEGEEEKASLRDADHQVSACDSVTEVEGEYHCAGECVTTGADGKKEIIEVRGETDTVKRFPGAKEELYQNNITGDKGFHEIEIGALTGRTLRAATAKVSDRQYPVLEEYVFETDAACRAQGFIKIVRDPSPFFFKSCLIRCKKHGREP